MNLITVRQDDCMVINHILRSKGLDRSVASSQDLSPS